MLNNLFVIIFLSLCATSLLSWWFLLQRRSSWLSLATVVPTQSPLGLLDVGIMFATWMGGQLAGLALLQLSGRSRLSGVESVDLPILIGVMSFSQLVFTGMGLGAIHLRHRASELFGWRPQSWWKDLGIGLIAFLLTVPPLLILQWSLTFLVEYSHSSLDAIKNNPSAIALLVVWFGAVISAPICEEVFFRGILQGWLQRLMEPETSLEQAIAGGWNPNPAEESQTRSRSRAGLPILMSSVAFAGVHIGQGLAPIPLFFLGLALGYLFFKTGRLLPCIVLHMALNGFSMFWLTLGALTQTK